MIKIEETTVYGWMEAIRGMRNPRNSWDKSDSRMVCCESYGTYEPEIKNVWMNSSCECPVIGPNDHELMMKLAAAGPSHSKYRRMIMVYADITAPLYWWKEFDTYKVGTVANSCSSLYDITQKEFTMDDFSTEHLIGDLLYLIPSDPDIETSHVNPLARFRCTISDLNMLRYMYLHYDETKEQETLYSKKDLWWQMIQLLPTSYNQKRTVMMNYEVLAGLYPTRKDHKLDEWHDFCHWIEQLPYSEIITGEEHSGT